MRKILAEGTYGHGARHSPFRRAIRKLWRKMNGRHISAKSGVSFDWKSGTDTIQKIGGIKMKNQGQNFSCGRQAGAYAQFILGKLRGIDEGEISAKSGYGQYCASGGGMDADSLETDICAWGANLESAVPSYDAHGSPLPEYLMEETSWETPALTEDALKRAGYTPFDVSVDMDSIALAVQNYGLVIWMIRGQNNGTWLSANPKPPSSSNPNPVWEHWMCVPIAIQKNLDNVITALNSWGESVGNRGMQDFTKEYVESGFILEAVAFVHDSQIQAATGNQSTWASINRWFRSLWGM